MSHFKKWSDSIESSKLASSDKPEETKKEEQKPVAPIKEPNKTDEHKKQ